MIRGVGGTQIWIGWGCATTGSEPIPMFRGTFSKSRYHILFVPIPAQGAYQSHFMWVLIKTLISRFFSLIVIFETKSMENNLETLL